jgi:hypothetical protein
MFLGFVASGIPLSPLVRLTTGNPEFLSPGYLPGYESALIFVQYVLINISK